MLQSHSLLWHYLWLGPGLGQVALAILIWRRGLLKLLPVFFAYAIYEAIETIVLYTVDILPSVSAETYWRVLWAGVIIEGLVKFAVIGELLRRLLQSRPGLGETGNRLFRCAGVGLALLATLAAVYTNPHNPHWLIGGALLLLQSLYIVQSGLILFVYLFAAYFKLTWERLTSGIALGFAIIFCERLASRAIEVSAALPSNTAYLDFVNMATYHVCVLIWFYYILVPQKVVTTSTVPLPENNLAVWNRELERLLHR